MTALVSLIAFVCFVCFVCGGFFIGYVWGMYESRKSADTRKVEDLAKKAAADEAAKKAKQDEIEMWSGLAARFISIPSAVRNAEILAKELILMRTNAYEFAKFCREDLEGHLLTAAKCWTCFWVESNHWAGDPRIFSEFQKVLRAEGFAARLEMPEDGQSGGKVFINVIGKEK